MKKKVKKRVSKKWLNRIIKKYGTWMDFVLEMAKHDRLKNIKVSNELSRRD